jgi:hypothetical protein
LCSSPLPFACTQRGEGLNRNLKPLLDLRSGLNKLYQEVTFRIEKETARTFQQDLKQTMHYSDLGGYAKQILPVLYAEACVLLTPYGLARWVKQLQARRGSTRSCWGCARRLSSGFTSGRRRRRRSGVSFSNGSPMWRTMGGAGF